MLRMIVFFCKQVVNHCCCQGFFKLRFLLRNANLCDNIMILYVLLTTVKQLEIVDKFKDLMIFVNKLSGCPKHIFPKDLKVSIL